MRTTMLPVDQVLVTMDYPSGDEVRYETFNGGSTVTHGMIGCGRVLNEGESVDVRQITREKPLEIVEQNNSPDGLALQQVLGPLRVFTEQKITNRGGKAVVDVTKTWKAE